MCIAASIPCLSGLALIVGGCTMNLPLAKSPPPFVNKVDLAKVQRLEVIFGGAPGIPCPELPEQKLILCKGGPCRATISFSRSRPGEGATEYELPPQMFEECIALLTETKFFEMQSVRPPPDQLFENSSTCLTVQCEEGQHLVSVIHPAVPPPGFDKLWAFATSFEKRGRLVKSTSPR